VCGDTRLVGLMGRVNEQGCDKLNWGVVCELGMPGVSRMALGMQFEIIDQKIPSLSP